MNNNQLTRQIIGAAIEVHRLLGQVFSDQPTKPTHAMNSQFEATEKKVSAKHAN
jgi:hypothetical protein